jgi:hypothetical protein
MQAIADSIERACGFSGDQVCLAVAMPQSTTPYLDLPSEEWEDMCTDTGFEFVDFEKTGKNDFGEKVGVHRVRESLEACEWESAEGLDFGDDEDGDDEGFGGFADEEAEMNMELFGMKGALHGFGDEEAGEPSAAEEAKEVEELEVMMRKMIAIKGVFNPTPPMSSFKTNTLIQKWAKAWRTPNANASPPAPSTTFSKTYETTIDTHYKILSPLDPNTIKNGNSISPFNFSYPSSSSTSFLSTNASSTLTSSNPASFNN